ncbi:MAG: hypothetical protein COZ95_10540 [Nitrospirae bacterium CG_4_8_14_3_um_filter_50_41]|nr:MAG: hypothetical protein COZ95_10540 [Nitrospirae bacterium CG_4_8_14_3_um_filter_50_41]
MKNGRLIGFILTAVGFSAGILFLKLSRTSIITVAFSIAGLAVLVIMSYVYFRSAKVHLYLLLGMFFAAIGVITILIFVEQYPLVVGYIGLICAILAAITTGIAFIKTVKNIMKK